MKSTGWLGAFVGLVLLCTSPVLAEDGFYVIAGNGAPGIKISSLPKSIETSGFYYLTGDLSCPSGNGITINANDVTVDLMGFTLSGTTGGSGVLMNGHRNVEVRNGTFTGWGTVISASYNDSGHRIINIRADSNSIGIFLYGLGHLVRGCTAVSNASQGIFVEGGTIKDNVASQNGTGIQCNWGSVIGNSVWCNAGQKGIQVSTDSQYATVVDQNAVSGPGSRFVGGSSSTITGTNAGF